MKRMLIFAALAWSSAATAQDENCQRTQDYEVWKRTLLAVRVLAASEKCSFDVDLYKIGRWVRGDAQQLTKEQMAHAAFLLKGIESFKNRMSYRECDFQKEVAACAELLGE